MEDESDIGSKKVSRKLSDVLWTSLGTIRIEDDASEDVEEIGKTERRISVEMRTI